MTLKSHALMQDMHNIPDPRELIFFLRSVGGYRVVPPIVFCIVRPAAIYSAITARPALKSSRVEERAKRVVSVDRSFRLGRATL